jgi:thiol-disulfide isomerase/thioredoxin
VRTIDDQLREYARYADEALPWVNPMDVMEAVKMHGATIQPLPSKNRSNVFAMVAAAVGTLLIVGGVAWLLGGGATTESADGSGPTLPLEFPVSELPPFQLEVRYQLDPGVATGPDGVPEDLEALMTVSYGGPDLLRVDVNRSVPLFFPGLNGEPGPPHEAAGSFIVWNHDEMAEYSAADGAFFLLNRDAQVVESPVAPLMWETWEDLCTYGEHEFLEASPVAGRETVHLRCTNGNDSYELWVDAETGLMLRIIGQDIPANLILIASGITATEYEVLAVTYEPQFAPDTFSLSAPQGAIVEDYRGVDQSIGPETLPKGVTVPELTGQFLDGGDFALADLEGSRVAVLFWASWCEPCLDVLSDLAAIATERPDITFVTVLIDDRPEDATAVLAERQIILPVVVPDGLDVNSYGAWDSYGEQWGSGIPLLVLVETDGTVAAYAEEFGPLVLLQGVFEDAGW